MCIRDSSYGYPSVTLTGDVKKDIMFVEEIIGVKLALSDHLSLIYICKRHPGSNSC